MCLQTNEIHNEIHKFISWSSPREIASLFQKNLSYNCIGPVSEGSFTIDFYRRDYICAIQNLNLVAFCVYRKIELYVSLFGIRTNKDKFFSLGNLAIVY